MRFKRLTTLFYSILCLYMANCQQIPFKPLPQISTPFITEQYYSVVLTLIYPKAEQIKKPINDNKDAAGNQKQLSTGYSDKIFESKNIPIISSTPKISQIQDYYAVVNIYPSLKDVFAIKEQQQKLLAVDTKQTIFPITKSTTQVSSQNQNQVRPQQKPEHRKDLLLKLQDKEKGNAKITYIIIIAIAFIVGAVLVKLNWRKDDKRKGNFRRLERFGQNYYDQREEEQEATEMGSHFNSQIIISDQFIDY